jgi:DNA-binding YbaB/EbfC family protein
MSKKRMGGMPGGASGGNLGMLKQLQKMQQDMQEAQEALAHETVEVTVGGGALTIVITGHQRVVSISINKNLIDTSDEEWLTDLQDMLVIGTISHRAEPDHGRREDGSHHRADEPGKPGVCWDSSAGYEEFMLTAESWDDCRSALELNCTKTESNN